MSSPKNRMLPATTRPFSNGSSPEIAFSVVDLAGAVGAEQRDEAAVRHGEREAAERVDRSAIDDVEAGDFERCGVIGISPA